jgi:hypothetical protein
LTAVTPDRENFDSAYGEVQSIINAITSINFFPHMHNCEKHNSGGDDDNKT